MINSIIEVRFIFNGSPLVAGEKNPSSGHQSLLWWPPDNIVVFIVKDVHLVPTVCPFSSNIEYFIHVQFAFILECMFLGTFNSVSATPQKNFTLSDAS